MKRNRKLRSVISLLLALLLAAGCLPVHASSDRIEGSKTASPAELYYDSRETEVTLSLPSAEAQNMIDLVFVMDNSTSVKNAGLDFGNEVSNLLSAIVEGNPGIDLKVGVVKFRGYATDMLGSGLMLYSDETAESILAAVKNTEVPGSGSNIHSGLMMAEQLLSADTAVKDDNKYVILLADGKSYIWNNEAGEPVMNYAQMYKSAAIQSSGRPVVSQTSGSNNREVGPTYASLPYEGESVLVYNNGTMGNARESSAYYQWLYDSGNEELKTVTKYDFPAYYSKYYDYSGTPEGSVEKIMPSNGTTAFPNPYTWYRSYYAYTPTAGTVWDSEDFHYFSVNPYNLTTDENGNTIFDTSSPNEDFFLLHPDTMQKGIYTAGHYWAEKLAAKYHTAAITPAPATIGSGSGLHIAASFSVWLRENSEYGAIITESSDVLELFENISNDIIYLVGSGEVEDVIPADFELVQPEAGAPFTVKLDGEELGVMAISETSWGFGQPADGSSEYPYEVSYDADARTIHWVIRVPIENAKPVTLSYKLLLSDEAAPGTYDTNESAVLTYTSSNGEKTGTYTFPIPQVTYAVRTGGVTVAKELSGSGADASESFSFRIELDGGELKSRFNLSEEALAAYLNGTYGDVTVTDGVGSFTLKGGESLSLSGLPESMKYTITENAPDGYTVTVNGASGESAEGTVLPNETATVLFVNEKEEETAEETTEAAETTEEETTEPAETTEEVTTAQESSADDGRPATGDSFPTVWVIVMAAALLLILVILLMRRSSSHSKN